MHASYRREGISPDFQRLSHHDKACLSSVDVDFRWGLWRKRCDIMASAFMTISSRGFPGV
jgi:hypothetical protein